VYYVNLPDGSGQSVRYFADDWGYHPLVSYSSSSKTGTTKTQLALGEKAVAALAKSKENNPSVRNEEYQMRIEHNVRFSFEEIIKEFPSLCGI
jgi:hypothetical protein